jgi:hypothetical protein
LAKVGDLWVPVLIELGRCLERREGLLRLIEHPEHHPALLSMIPPVVGSLAIRKVAAGIWVYAAVRRRRLLEARQIQSLAVLWVIGVAAGVALASLAAPALAERCHRLVPVVVVFGSRPRRFRCSEPNTSCDRSDE